LRNWHEEGRKVLLRAVKSCDNNEKSN